MTGVLDRLVKHRKLEVGWVESYNKPISLLSC